MAVAHLALDLGARHQRGDRIDHQHVDRVGADQRVDDLERLLAGIGLRDDQFVDVDAQLLGIARVERMLGVDEGGGAAGLLRLGDGVQRQRRLARAFRPVNLDHPAARQAADAERDVEPEAAGRDGLDLDLLAAAELHRRALAERAVDLRQRGFQCLLLVRVHAISVRADDFELRCHGLVSSSIGRPVPSRVKHVRIMICSTRTRGEHNSIISPLAVLPSASSASRIAAAKSGRS